MDIPCHNFFDIWHGSKNLGKKIFQVHYLICNVLFILLQFCVDTHLYRVFTLSFSFKAAQEKLKKPLSALTRGVVNNFWYCSYISKTETSVCHYQRHCKSMKTNTKNSISCIFKIPPTLFNLCHFY